VLADLWPDHRRPDHLVRALAAAGADVTVAGGPQPRRRVLRRAVSPVARDSDLVYAPLVAEEAVLSELVRGRTIVLVHDGAPRAARPSPLLPRAADVQAASPALADRALAIGAEPARVRVVRPGVDVGALRPPARPRAVAPGTLRLACPAPLHWSAGLEYLLVALRRVLDRGVDVFLDLHGEGPFHDGFLFTASDLEILPRVTLHPQRSRQALLDVLRSADACVLAGVEDRPWVGVLEAMACGLPVIATDGPSVRDAVRPGREGVLVPARDPEALAGALGRVAADPEGRRAMGEAGRRRVTEAFALELAAREVVPGGPRA
jgi:glycosyltransferase involved in cell wall biosynthesis